jgi:hypothetical protein
LLRRRRKQRKEEKIVVEEKMKMKLELVDIVHRQKMKAEPDKLKMKEIKKYARDMENILHYALATIVILIDVVIALSGLFRCK